MKKCYPNIAGAPPVLGPYSLAVSSSGPLLFVSGIIPWNPKTNSIERGNITEQTELVLENMKLIIEKSGADISQVISCRVYINPLTTETFRAMNTVYSRYFQGDNLPARVTVGAILLGCDVEIESVVSLSPT